MAGIGRFGSYVQHGKTYANLEPGDDVLTVGLNRAITLIAEKKLKPGGGRRFASDPGRPLGDHPDKGGPVVVKNGRYGPYVSHDGVNATLPADMTPESITLEQALPLLDARAARGTGKGKKALSKPRTAAKIATKITAKGVKAPEHAVVKGARAKPARKSKAASKPAKAPSDT
jgi:DNA topoisomerase-1